MPVQSRLSAGDCFVAEIDPESVAGVLLAMTPGGAVIARSTLDKLEINSLDEAIAIDNYLKKKL